MLLQGSVAHALIRTYWRDVAVGGILCLVDSTVQLASPVLLQRLLVAVQKGSPRGSLPAYYSIPDLCHTSYASICLHRVSAFSCHDYAMQCSATSLFQSSPILSGPIQSKPSQVSSVQSISIQSNNTQSNPIQSNPTQSVPVQSTAGLSWIHLVACKTQLHSLPADDWQQAGS